MRPPYWSLAEVKPADWWAVDITTGTAFSLPIDTGERLWRRHDLLGLPLSEALDSDQGREDVTAFVDLEFCGVSARYLCIDELAAEQIRTLYTGATPVRRRSPDVLVRIQLGADIDRLHRAVSSREGVEVGTVDGRNWITGSLDLPIIPPLQSALLAGRYCALHGALISADSGGVLVCGKQRTGKTSAALLADRLGLGRVLADELVLIDQQGEAYGVPLPLRERAASGRGVSPFPRRIGVNGDRAEVRTLILLEESHGPPSWRRLMDTAEALRLVTPHIRALDGPLGRATVSVLLLLNGADVWLWRLRDWPSLTADLEQGLRSLLGTHYET